MVQLNTINPKELNENVFELIGDKWMLITAVKEGKVNTMTASWGGLGVLWSKNVAFCTIRPVRYTYEFIEQAESFTLSFFPDEYKSALNLLGKKSGRDGNKIEEAGLHTIFVPDSSNKLAFFKEAKLTLICKKIYAHAIIPENFVVPELDKFYPEKDYHKMYIGEITDCLVIN